MRAWWCVMRAIGVGMVRGDKGEGRGAKGCRQKCVLVHWVGGARSGARCSRLPCCCQSPCALSPFRLLPPSTAVRSIGNSELKCSEREKARAHSALSAQQAFVARHLP